jgi:hypothetical protein
MRAAVQGLNTKARFSAGTLICGFPLTQLQLSHLIPWDRIRTDSVEGRIRVDLGGFRVIFGVFYSIYGHFDPIKPDSGFGRIRYEWAL